MNKTLAVILGLWLACLPALATAQEMLRVGVRSDAWPFSSLDKDTGKFEGFIYEICAFSFRAIGFKENVDFRLLPVTAENRLKGLIRRNEEGVVVPREFDMVCDPTSVTIERIGKLIFSRTLFVSGGSYLQSNRALDDVYDNSLTTLTSRVDNELPITLAQGEAFETDASLSNVRSTSLNVQRRVIACADLSDSQIPGAILGYVRETTGEALINKALSSESPPVSVANFQVMCSRGFPSHQAAIIALCNSDITHHFGDRDIINSALLRYKREGHECDAEVGETVYTSEPYAIAFSPELERERVLLLQKAVLITLSSAVESKSDEGSTVARLTHHLFTKYFPDQTMSTVLRSLYLHY